MQIKPWDKSSVEDVKDIFTVVKMYKKDSHGKHMGELEKVTLEGSVDAIFSTKVNGMLPDRLVVIAAAGKGKTTAVAKMAYDWSYSVIGSAFEKVPLLFILRLREVTKEASIGQAIIEQLLPEVEELSAAPLEQFIRSNQNLCWIIFDGLDEFAGRITSKTKAAGNIVKVLTCKDLPGCRVLVTTRPHLETDFEQDDLPRVYAKMEIEGFSTHNQGQYIHKFFRNDVATGIDLQNYLEQNDIISELVSTPLFCLMVCYLWREGLLEGIDTQTKLFENINTFLWHHSRSRSEKYTEKWLNSIVMKLGKIAYKGLMCDSNKLVFTEEDFRMDLNALHDGCELGIISRSDSLDYSYLSNVRSDAKTSVEFYHKLAQEHVAGLYLAHDDNSVWSKFKTPKLESLFSKKCTQIGNYEHLLRFASGINNEICVKVMNGILLNDNLEETERYRMVLDCSSESSALGGDVKSMVRRFIGKGTVVLKSPTIYTVAGIKKLPVQIKKEVK